MLPLLNHLKYANSRENGSSLLSVMSYVLTLQRSQIERNDDFSGSSNPFLEWILNYLSHWWEVIRLVDRYPIIMSLLCVFF